MDIEGIVLAAGFSKRAGIFKMELMIDNKTMIEHSIQGMYDICSRIIVVGGYKIEIIKEILKKYPKVDIIFNRNYKKGMFSSVKTGIQHIKSDKFFLLPGDVPFVKEAVYKKMLSIQGDIVIPSYKGRKGHPVLIKSYLINEILAEPKNSNLKIFINKKGYTLAEVEDEAILLDIDTLEDYKKAENKSYGSTLVRG
ncbi:MAG: nucleotidyltransferase family protein [Candidatus Cloacimonadota bacterium]|nr:nucleotidyltransferase family protein [Candidatus Cloacimonadota bacterium]